MPIVIPNLEEVIISTQRAIETYPQVSDLPDFIERSYRTITEDQRLNFLETIQELSVKSKDGKFGANLVTVSYSLAKLLVEVPEQKQNYLDLILAIDQKNTFHANNTASTLVDELIEVPEEHQEFYLKSMRSIVNYSKQGGGDFVQILGIYFADLLKTAHEERKNYVGLMVNIVAYHEGFAKKMAATLGGMLQEYTYDSVKKFVEEGFRIGNQATRDFYKRLDETNPPILEKKHEVK